MSTSSFIKGLGISCVLSYVAYFCFTLITGVDNYFDLMNYAVILYVAIAVIIYWFSIKGIQSENKNFFIQIIVYNVFIKLVLSFALIFVYVKVAQPTEKLFVIPFLMVYLLFTIFETYFLSNQSRLTK